ncbi:protein virB10 [Asticcacaulis biprosthecium C19]|uniref:Protein virB10 n=1 Tax=Asticcacaulis biprosthecium C19 TaxID=715226 RepID=F4QNF3_9CAUL|nr:type IV secretion system protein VirB10 [Asticcacaulis biprosthecium]EGF90861.1 protein virB10 [Asticcacaulis biprosthecium C19]
MARNPLPAGNDPRLNLPESELDAASAHAMPQVAKKGGLGDHLGLAAGIIGVGILGIVTFISLGNTPPPPVQQPPAQVVTPPASTLPPIDPSANPPLFEPQPQPGFAQPMPPQQPQPGPAPVDPAAARAPAMIVDNSNPPSAQQAAQAAAPATAAPQALNSNQQFLASANGEVSQRAWRIGDPSKVVPQGAVIPAVLETAINSDLPGYTRAVVSRDIRSFDGTTILIPKGSRLVGQYKSGLTSGETRAFIIWNRLIRPDGLSIQLASPATDDLGQAGMSGKVDSHFAKRFGSAMLLSVVNGLSTALSGKSGSTIVIGSSSGATGLISDALSNDMKIPPTIKVPQGAKIQVFAARDLDFNLGQ